MNKQTLKITILTLLVLVVFSLGMMFQPHPAGLAQTAQTIPQTPVDQPRTVSVTGTGEVSIVPDVAILVLGVQTDAEEASSALSQNNDATQAVLDQLTASGIAKDDIQTQAINLTPRYDQSTNVNGTGEVIGYTAQNTLEIRVHELEMTGDILDMAVQAGANLIQSIRFEVSDPTQAVAQAREAAMKDVRDKATQLATLAGAQLGPVLTIQELGSTPVQRDQVETLAAAPVPIAAGTQSIQIQVSVTWAIQSNILDTTQDMTATPTP